MIDGRPSVAVGLRTAVRFALVFVVTFVSVVFLGGISQAYSTWTPGEWSPNTFLDGGYVHTLSSVSQTAGSVGTNAWAPTFTISRAGSPASATGFFWQGLCVDPVDLVTVDSSKNSSYSHLTSYPRTTQPGACTGDSVLSRFRVWSNDYGNYDDAPADHRMEWNYVEQDGGVAECASGTLSDVYVWETSEGVGFSFKWTGSTAWNRWRIHKSGNLASTYGHLDGYVAEGAATAYWRSDNDPANTSVFAPGDSVKLRRFSDGTAGDPTSCWVEVTVLGVAHDWTTEGGSSGGPSDLGEGATDPDTAVACSGFDIVCRIKAVLAWAFVPQAASTEQFGTLMDDLGDKIPFVYVDGAINLFSFNVRDCENGALCTGWSYPHLLEFDISALTGSSDEITVLPAGDPILQWMRDYRVAISVFVWILMLAPFGIWIWRRLFPVVGSGGQ